MRHVALCFPVDVDISEMEWSPVERTLAERLLINPVALKKFMTELQRQADAVYRPKAGTFDSYALAGVQFEPKLKSKSAFPELSGALSGGAL